MAEGKFFTRSALLSAVRKAKGQFSILVGSPISKDADGGVPGIDDMLSIVEESVCKLEEDWRRKSYFAAVKGKRGQDKYQEAMCWVQGNIDQDAVNSIVRTAVLMAYTGPKDAAGKPTATSDPKSWSIPTGLRALGELVVTMRERFGGPILTPNFDPLISHAIRLAGGNPRIRALQTDGNLSTEVETNPDEQPVVHIHGYWQGKDTMHTPAQIAGERPGLKAYLQRLLRKHPLLVVAYGGWEDTFMKSITELEHDDDAKVDILWCFYEDDAGRIEDSNNFLKNINRLRLRGRFRAYRGIDCHSLFSDIIVCDELEKCVAVKDAMMMGAKLSNILDAYRRDGITVEDLCGLYGLKKSRIEDLKYSEPFLRQVNHVRKLCRKPPLGPKAWKED